MRGWRPILVNTENETTNIIVPYLSELNETLFDMDLIPVHDPNKDRIFAVFNHWVETCRNPKRPPILDAKRRRYIEKALKLYDVDTLKKAIEGNAASDFHRGDNARGRVYDELTLILRDAEHIEEFVAYTETRGAQDDEQTPGW